MRTERNSVHELGGLAFDITCSDVDGTGGGKGSTWGSDGELMTLSILFVREVGISGYSFKGVGFRGISGSLRGRSSLHGKINYAGKDLVKSPLGGWIQNNSLK